MAADAFRSQMNSLGWSRREEPAVTTSASSPFLSRIQSMNPFASGSSGYVRLPTSYSDPPPQLPARTRQEEDEAFFALSRWDRILAFSACNLGAAACFVVCFFLFPVLSLKPRKFAVLWTVGSLLFLSSWAILQGPITYAKHLMSTPRLPFTAAYFGTILCTLYFSVGLQSTILTLLAAICQMVALVWYLVSYFPMGSTGLRYASSFGARQATAWMQG
ncbi:Got1/Sft2-like family-domain-containing protein [Tricharina praecox]|uniref:Got1/Sft2-like family-domain-containing protein n=1 Tax=Tricharina praecox TaxID=43433 RepID=UPI0022205120|nr:Got1/Sft2-like family-domain-containing protein [Tricharina praecox]KAI5855691.1 Got1/Sft2-like family-domain-containing protein [Tricharina praecox]